jgi:exonuclease SbcC
LFVRLAPTEPFVPAFKLPDTPDGVVAVLETLHRSGHRGGTPASMLSAGNLNTAALTLFLALHLSVEPRLPWLVLDDPVQSMDEVHIAQFAALLRTLSKAHGRKILIAVHDRSLFDYLTLELSPAFVDDQLITVELSRLAGDSTIATPRFWPYHKDDAIAA